MASSKSLLNSFQETLKRREAKSSRRRLTVLPQGSVDFSSNDFLSLSSSSAFRTRFLHHINSAPASQPLASGGSRLLDGNSHYAEDLERFIAGFHDAPSGLLFNSGYDANVGVFSCIPQPKDVILYDELIHASIHEGMRLSRAAKRIKFPHNSPSGLKEVLQKQVQDDQEILKGTRNVFIAIETVYSMDGDIAPVKEFIQVVRDLLPQGNGYFIVDEAHATGVFGPHGAGVIQDLGVQEHIFIRVHTFGKALASHGAIVLCDPLTRDYLINYARSLIYTTAAAFPSLVSIRTAYELLQEGETDSLRENLKHLIQHFRTRIRDMHLSESSILEVDHFPDSPIFSFRSPLPRDLATACQRKGFIVRAIMPPTVPVGKERVRVCLHAGNTTREIDDFLAVVQRWTAEKKGGLSRL